MFSRKNEWVNGKRVDKRLPLPLSIALSTPLYSCTCIDDLFTCEPTTLFKIPDKDSNNCKNLELSINEKIVKRSKESLDDKESDIFQEDIIRDLNFLHVKVRTAVNQNGVELQSLVPVVGEDKEKSPLNFGFNNCKEFRNDNEKKI